MSNVRALAELNNGGHILDIITGNFGGKTGRLYPRKDSDFIVSFEEGKVPDGRVLKKEITENYQEKGYRVKCLDNIGPESFTLSITPESGDSIMIVVVTVNYPLTIGQGDNNHLRVTTSFI